MSHRIRLQIEPELEVNSRNKCNYLLNTMSLRFSFFQSLQSNILAIEKFLNIYLSQYPFDSETDINSQDKSNFNFLEELIPPEPISNQLLVEFQYLQSPYWKLIPNEIVSILEWKMIDEISNTLDSFSQYINQCKKCWNIIMIETSFPHSFKNIFERKYSLIQSELSYDEIIGISSVKNELFELMMKMQDDIILKQLLVNQEKKFLHSRDFSQSKILSLANNELVKSKIKEIEVFNIIWRMNPMITRVIVDEKLYKIENSLQIFKETVLKNTS